MKKTIISLIFVLIFCAAFSYAKKAICGGEEARSEVPIGMQVEKVGDLNLLLPKGAEVRKTAKGGLLNVETIDEYTSRKVEEIENRLENLEKGQEELREDIKQLKESLNQPQEKSLISR